MKKIFAITCLVFFSVAATAQKTGKIGDSVYRVCNNEGVKVFTSSKGVDGDAYYVFYTKIKGDTLYASEENFTGKISVAEYGPMMYVRNIAIPFKNAAVTVGEVNNKWRGGDIYQIKIEFASLNIKRETINNLGKKSNETVQSAMLIVNGQANAEAIKKALGK
jgi:hypothetical protein